MHLYADEDIPFSLVQELRRLGHDILTAEQDGRKGTPDAEILARAYSLKRAVITHNRWDFENLHSQGLAHSGILSATRDDDVVALAANSWRSGRPVPRPLVPAGQPTECAIKSKWRLVHLSRKYQVN